MGNHRLPSENHILEVNFLFSAKAEDQLEAERDATRGTFRDLFTCFFPALPIWLGQKWLLLHQKCTMKSSVRLLIASMRPNPQHVHRCRALAETRHLEPNRKGRKLSDAWKPGRTFEFESLSGVGPSEQVLKTTLAQLPSPYVQLLPSSLQVTWGNGST